LTPDPDITCDNAQENLVAYVQEEIGDRKLARKIEAHLAECEICRRQVAEIRRTFQMARETYHDFVPSEQVWKELLERLHRVGAGAGQGVLRNVQERLGPKSESPPPVAAPAPEARVAPRSRRMIAAVLSVAAIVVLVAGAALLLSLTRFRVVLKNGSQVSMRAPGDDRWLEMKPGGSIGVGASVRTETASFNVVLEYPDGSRIEMSPDTELKIVEEKAVKLERGELTADIMPSGAGFTVRTEFGDIEALGTRFTVSVSRRDLSTRLRVHEGRVRFTQGGVERIVEAGYESHAGRGMAPVEPRAFLKKPLGERYLTPECLDVSLSVFDGHGYRDHLSLEMPRIPSDAPLRVRFEVRNKTDRELTLPTGRTGGWEITLMVKEEASGGGGFLRKDVTTAGVMLTDKPSTRMEDKEVRIGPGQVYQFEYEIALERLRMLKGRKYDLVGSYCLVSSQAVAVEVK